MGLFKSTPPSPPSDLPVWLVRSPHESVEDAWVYQVIRGGRHHAEPYGILPWDTLPGVKQVASDYMNREREIVKVIGVVAGGMWAAWDLPCPQPPVPGARLADAPVGGRAPASRLGGVDRRVTAARLGAMLVADHEQSAKIWEEADDDIRSAMLGMAVTLLKMELRTRQKDPAVVAQEIMDAAAELEAG
jgi:hypothetical protein